MSRLTILALALLAALPARADGPLDAAQARQIDRARAMKDSGIALTAIGAAAVVTGAVLGVVWMASFSGKLDDKHNPDFVAAFFPAGLAVANSGVLFIGAGAPLWAVGRKREQKARATAPSLSANGVLHF
jgi:hypothetical protein